MAAFSIFESFFFLMLATTFVLILLLVYHFKNRITSMEEKNDKLFSIIRSLAEELNSLKDNPYPLNMHPLNVTTNFDSKTNEHSDKFIDLNDIDHSNLVNNIDLDDFDDEDDDEINTEDLEEEFDDEIEMIRQDPDEDGDDEEDEDEDEDSQFDNEENDKITIPKEIKKIVVEESEIVDELVEVAKEEEKKEYKNLNLSELKQLVISKGLATNTSKMRKNDLISLLEENDKTSDDENF
tara:strand:+ start:20707 stop:21420 length:714 start_codon:yes stop_codon:yes gene_type:complete